MTNIEGNNNKTNSYTQTNYYLVFWNKIRKKNCYIHIIIIIIIVINRQDPLFIIGFELCVCVCVYFLAFYKLSYNIRVLIYFLFLCFLKKSIMQAFSNWTTSKKNNKDVFLLLVLVLIALQYLLCLFSL